MNKENCALKLVDEIILYYDARSKKHQINYEMLCRSAVFPLWPLFVTSKVYISPTV